MDWVARRLYWVDAGSDTVSVATLDGRMRHTLVSTGLDQPHDIVLDPKSGLVHCYTSISVTLILTIGKFRIVTVNIIALLSM